jgi:hypothetical protein
MNDAAAVALVRAKLIGGALDLRVPRVPDVGQHYT